MTATALPQKVLDSAERHKQLIAAFRELAYVPDAHTAKTEELEIERLKLSTAQAESDKMAEQQKQAYDDVQALNSRLTRLSLSVKRRPLDSETQAREQNYQAAFAEGQVLLERVEKLEASVAQLDLEVGDLAQLAVRRAELDGELTLLYESVFLGGVGNADEEEAKSLVYALELQNRDINHRADRLRDGLDVCGKFLEAIEHAERQFRKAQKATTDQNGHSKKRHHKKKSKAIYAEARRWEAQVHDLQPQFVLFAQGLPRGDSPRKHHCRELKAYWGSNRVEMERQLAQAKRDLETAEGEMRRAKAELRRVRCAIMEHAVPPPQYQKKA